MSGLTEKWARHALEERLAVGPMPEIDALQLAIHVTEALRAIHNHGQVHSGLSPEAILLTEDGVELEPAVHHPHITPYTAPEALDGADATPAGDIFSFGAVFYEMLTGHRAFEGASEQELRGAILMSTPARVGKQSLDRLIQTCLAKDVRARYFSMQRVVLELRVLLLAARCAETVKVHPRGQSETRVSEEVTAVRRYATELHDTIMAYVRTVEEKGAEHGAQIEWVVELLGTLQASLLDK